MVRNANMKIIAVIPSLLHGGAEKVLSLLSKEWEREHSVKIVAFDGRQRAYRFGGSLIDLGLPRPGSWHAKIYTVCAGIRSLVRLFRRDQPDRIVSFMEPANFPVVFAAMLIGVRDRVVVSVHHDPVSLPKVRQWMIPLFYRSPVTVASVSDGVKRALISLSVPASLVRTVHNPIDTTSTSSASPRPFSRKYILGVGRLHWDKGFDRLLQSFEKIQCPDLQLVILGDGPERHRLESLACNLGLSDRVEFAGAVPDVSRWYAHAECLAVSSRTEAWALVIVEAMSNGCPVVSFACNYGPSEIIEHECNGLLVPEGDEEALSRAIRRVVSDEGLRQRLGAAGLTTAVKYDVHRVAESWLM